MVKSLKISLAIAALIAGISFACVSIGSTQRRIQRIERPGGDTWVEEYDTMNPNKGSFMIGYSIIAGCCLLASGILFSSLQKDDLK